MLLVINKPGSHAQEYRFTRGPVYLGRHQDCHVQLAGGMVSRQHAVIFITLEGQTILKDLESSNGTYLNGQPIKEEALHNGDRIHIGEFCIHTLVDEEVLSNADELLADDTELDNRWQTQVIRREHIAKQGPDIILPITRATDLARASRALCAAATPQQFLQTLLVLLLQQFHASRVWCSLRADVSGVPGYAVGASEKGQTITLEDLELAQEIQQVLETGQFYLIPSTGEDDRVRIPCSAMIAPLPQWHKRLGVLYLDRHADWKPFSLCDLDYLMILAIEAGAMLGASHNQKPLDSLSESES